MLDGHVQIVQHLFIAHHGGHKFICDALGVGVKKANPHNALHLVQLVQQAGNFHLAPVRAKGGDILCHHNQLFYAFPGKPARLGHTAFHRAAAQRPADERDCAISTAV